MLTDAYRKELVREFVDEFITQMILRLGQTLPSSDDEESTPKRGRRAASSEVAEEAPRRSKKKRSTKKKRTRQPTLPEDRVRDFLKENGPSNVATIAKGVNYAAGSVSRKLEAMRESKHVKKVTENGSTLYMVPQRRAKKAAKKTAKKKTATKKVEAAAA